MNSTAYSLWWQYRTVPPTVLKMVAVPELYSLLQAVVAPELYSLLKMLVAPELCSLLEMIAIPGQYCLLRTVTVHTVIAQYSLFQLVAIPELYRTIDS